MVLPDKILARKLMKKEKKKLKMLQEKARQEKQAEEQTAARPELGISFFACYLIGLGFRLHM